MKFFIKTFGCRTNQADSAAIAETLLKSGYKETASASEADLIVLNSCTVTHRSDQQVRQLARRFRRENREAKIVITGCYAQRDPHSLAEIRGVSAVVGNTYKQGLVRIADALAAESSSRQSPVAIHYEDFERQRAIELAPAIPIGGKTRPFVKIQDGCDAKCSYCIIPSVRGPSRSVPPDQILNHVSDLIASGFPEIVLTGIHIGTYGLFLSPRYPLDRLLTDICHLPGLGQLRLSSIEPMELSRRVIKLAASTDKIAPHFHICLQSGADRILRRMRRPYSSQRFLDIVEEIRDLIPHAAIGTDVIAGFPGETEEDHLTTLSFVSKAPFTYLHVFPYSDRTGTRANLLGEKVPSEVIKKRSAELRALSRQLNEGFRSQFLGQQLSLLTLTSKMEGKREALTGNYLKALADGRLSGNRLWKGTALKERGGYLVFRDLRPV